MPATIAVLVRTPGGPNVQRLLEAVAAAGHRGEVLVPRALAGRDPDAWPDAIVTRVPSGTPATELATLAGLDALAAAVGPGTIWLGRPGPVVAAQDKPTVLRRLAAAGLPVPPTLVVTRGAVPGSADLPSTGTGCVVKPVAGSAGRGVVVGLSPDRAARAAASFADLCGPVMVQPLLGDGSDHRLLVVDGEVVATMRRRPTTASAGRGSVLYGAAAEPWHPSPEHTELARRAAAALSLDVAGVDLVLAGAEPVILEVNACPGLAAVEATTGRDVAGALVAAVAARLARRGRVV